MFTNPPGYRFGDVPAQLKAEETKPYEGLPEVKGFDARVVTHDGGPPEITVVAVAWGPEGRGYAPLRGRGPGCACQ